MADFTPDKIIGRFKMEDREYVVVQWEGYPLDLSSNEFPYTPMPLHFNESPWREHVAANSYTFSWPDWATIRPKPNEVPTLDRMKLETIDRKDVGYEEYIAFLVALSHDNAYASVRWEDTMRIADGVYGAEICYRLTIRDRTSFIRDYPAMVVPRQGALVDLLGTRPPPRLHMILEPTPYIMANFMIMCINKFISPQRTTIYWAMQSNNYDALRNALGDVRRYNQQYTHHIFKNINTLQENATIIYFYHMMPVPSSNIPSEIYTWFNSTDYTTAFRTMFFPGNDDEHLLISYWANINRETFRVEATRRLMDQTNNRPGHNFTSDKNIMQQLQNGNIDAVLNSPEFNNNLSIVPILNNVSDDIQKVFGIPNAVVPPTAAPPAVAPVSVHDQIISYIMLRVLSDYYFKVAKIIRFGFIKTKVDNNTFTDDILQKQYNTINNTSNDFIKNLYTRVEKKVNETMANELYTMIEDGRKVPNETIQSLFTEGDIKMLKSISNAIENPKKRDLPDSNNNNNNVAKKQKKEVVDLYPYGEKENRMHTNMCLKGYSRTGSQRFYSFKSAMLASFKDPQSAGITRNESTKKRLIGTYTVRKGPLTVHSPYETSWLKTEWTREEIEAMEDNNVRPRGGAAKRQYIVS